MKRKRMWIITTFLGIQVFVFLLLVKKLSTSSYAGLFKQSFIPGFNMSTIQRHIVQQTSEERQVCIQPELQPFGGHVKKHIFKHAPVICKGESDWVIATNGYLTFNIPVQYNNATLQCKIIYIKRRDDFYTSYTLPQFIDINLKTRLSYDHFRIACFDTLQNLHVHDRLYSSIAEKSKLKQKSANQTTSDAGLGFNVLILGFDSVSHMGFMRNLPDSYKYFTKDMKGVVYNGYNIVGDATFRNILAFTTGKREHELPSTQLRFTEKHYTDDYPLIWKLYKKSGYVTGYAEDCAYIGSFGFRRTGFISEPTDHYMRPFYLTLESEEREFGYPQFCIGSKKRIHVFFDWLKQFWSVYEKQRKFMFAFHSEQSHSDNINLLGTVDVDLQPMLKYLHTSPQFSDTVIFLMSDHGSRFSGMRATLQGKQEERLPFFGIVVPEKFRKLYPEAVKNLYNNKDRLTTPFDAHKTLHEIVSFTGAGRGNSSERGISFFKSIPKSRTCAQASVDEHWCACLDWKSVNTSDIIVKSAAYAIIRHINKLISSHSNICQNMSLSNISRAMFLLPTERLLQFSGSKGDDKTEELFYDNTRIGLSKYQIWLYADPGHALYEVTLTHSKTNNSFSINTDDISRLNKYGHAADCIGDDKADLRKFCFCKPIK